MDSKEKFLVDEPCRRITQQTFHERDVLAPLILLREHSTAESPVREFADFIAHREKDRGASVGRIGLERETGLGPATLGLGSRCSTN
jgi:hypothetical protein